MNELVPDEYCVKIFATLMINYKKTRFNELHRLLTKFKVKMSKPTLVQHLTHFMEKKIVIRDAQDTQNVTYALNWTNLEQLMDAQRFNKRLLAQTKNEKAFKSLNLSKQVWIATEMLTLQSMYYLKLQILDLLEPRKETCPLLHLHYD